MAVFGNKYNATVFGKCYNILSIVALILLGGGSLKFVIDLSKAWEEHKHPRGAGGRFGHGTGIVSEPAPKLKVKKATANKAEKVEPKKVAKKVTEVVAKKPVAKAKKVADKEPAKPKAVAKKAPAKKPVPAKKAVAKKPAPKAEPKPKAVAKKVVAKKPAPKDDTSIVDDITGLKFNDIYKLSKPMLSSAKKAGEWESGQTVPFRRWYPVELAGHKAEMMVASNQGHGRNHIRVPIGDGKYMHFHANAVDNGKGSQKHQIDYAGVKGDKYYAKDTVCSATPTNKPKAVAKKPVVAGAEVIKDPVPKAVAKKPKAVAKAEPIAKAPKAPAKKPTPKAKADPIAKVAKHKVLDKKLPPKELKDPVAPKTESPKEPALTISVDPDIASVTNEWNAPDVQAIMSTPANKRDKEQMSEIAGRITLNNDKLVRSIVLKTGKACGLNLVGQTNLVDGHRQETNAYGDLLQAGRAEMYSTLYKMLSGQEVGGDAGGHLVGARCSSRIRAGVNEELDEIMKQLPVPQRIRGAVRDMRVATTKLSNDLGRKPTNAELASHLVNNSDDFNNAPIMADPVYVPDDHGVARFNMKERISDPIKRLEMLQTYDNRQRTMSTDIDHDDDEGNSFKREVADSHMVEPTVVRKINNEDLKTELPRAMREMGLHENSIAVLSKLYDDSGKNTMDDVAEALGVSRQYVGKWAKAGMDKFAEAREANHPALKRLKLFKSLRTMAIFKTLYEIDLIKSLNSFGLGSDIMVEKFVRVEYGTNTINIQKSLDTHEYVGSYTYNEYGQVQARIVELVLPEDDILCKALSMENLEKSMFPHKGTNHEVNQKIKEYVKANKGKYEALSKSQHSAVHAVRAKGGKLTWSQQLLIDNPGSCWLTWGGKRVLVNGSTGEQHYNSSHDADREEHNNGAPEDKIDFHHEADGVDDHGINATKADLDKMRTAWQVKDGNKGVVSGVKHDLKREHTHKMIDGHTDLTDEEKEHLDKGTKEDHIKFYGKHFLDKPGVKEALQKYHDEAKAGNEEEARKEVLAKLGSIDSIAGRTDKAMTGAKRYNFATGFLENVRKNDPSDPKNMEALEHDFGTKEMSHCGMAVDKTLLPKGHFAIGDPATGKTLYIDIDHGYAGGNTGNYKGRKYTAVITGAFDPDTGEHVEGDAISWDSLARKLGLPSAKFQETLCTKANTSDDQPFLKKLTDEEYSKQFAGTKKGLQDSMLHTKFVKSGEGYTKDGKTGRYDSDDNKYTTYSQSVNGTVNSIDVGKDGQVADPVMARLLRQDKPIENEKDMNEALKKAVGNRAWVTVNDPYLANKYGHHIQLEYDGKGAPRVVGGQYNGYRFMDSRDVKKGAIDPATGEPIQTLFKNGRVVDTKTTSYHAVPMAEGNAVMYPSGDGWRRGKIVRTTDDGNFQVQHADGMLSVHKPSELKNAKDKGMTTMDNGQAVAKLATTKSHRIDLRGLSDAERDKLVQAMDSAKVRKHRDEDGSVIMGREPLELSEAQMRRTKEKLGRSKVASEVLKKFNVGSTSEIEMHIPAHLKDQVESLGLRVMKNGTVKVSASKFEDIRKELGSVGMHSDAREHLSDYFKSKDRVPKTIEELTPKFQPSAVDPNTDFGKHYRAQFKKDSFLMQEGKGLYGTQLEGVSHLIDRKRGIVGHGMGVGKTITGVVASEHAKAQKLAEGKVPKKTLVVSPAGIRSDWGKEIANHTNSKALYIGSKGDRNGQTPDTNGKHTWGQEGSEQEHVLSSDYHKNPSAHSDADYHIVTYEEFRKNRDKYANSGHYDNIIIDEVHAFKNQKGSRGKSLAETTAKFGNVWGLSGTPIENDAREIHSLIDTITGGKHELGSSKEFVDNFLMKDKNGKVVGIQPAKANTLGDALANVVQFRGGSDVSYVEDGVTKKVHFPALAGEKPTEGQPNPTTDFIGNMVDGNRDHNTNDSYGTKHSITDFTTGSKVAKSNGGGEYTVSTSSPANTGSGFQKMYADYQKLQAQHLPANKLQELETASATGYSNTQVGSKNYLTGMMKLQKFLNAPLANDIYTGEGKSGIESNSTDAQGEKGGKGGLKPFNPATGEGHYTTDEQGFKRYLQSDGKGSYLKNPDGSPKVMAPLHHDNPKAQYLKQRLHTYLDHLEKENADRRKNGKPELMPKAVIKSDYTTFGTDVISNVLKEVQNEHPELQRWAQKVQGQYGKPMTHGSFTGADEDRETTKTAYRGSKKQGEYANDQGSQWAVAVSPAGKEGIDLGNSHLMIHYDQNYNPQKMAQFTARVRRSDSHKAHTDVDRPNSVRVESLHVPGTIEDFMFNIQDAKIKDTEAVKTSTRNAEQAKKYGDSHNSAVYSGRRFTKKEGKSKFSPKLVIPAEAHKRSKKVDKKPETGHEYQVASSTQKSIKTSSKRMVLYVLI